MRPPVSLRLTSIEIDDIRESQKFVSVSPVVIAVGPPPGRPASRSRLNRQQTRRLTRLLIVLDDLRGVLLGLLLVLGGLLLSLLVLLFGLLLCIVFSLLFVLFVLKLRLLVVLLLLLLLFFIGVVVGIGVVHQHDITATKVGAGGGRSDGRLGWRGARRNPLIGHRFQRLQHCGCGRRITCARGQDMDKSEKGDDGCRGEHCLQEAAAPTAPTRTHVTNVESSFDICGHKSLWLACLC